MHDLSNKTAALRALGEIALEDMAPDAPGAQTVARMISLAEELRDRLYDMAQTAEAEFDQKAVSELLVEVGNAARAVAPDGVTVDVDVSGIDEDLHCRAPFLSQVLNEVMWNSMKSFGFAFGRPAVPDGTVKISALTTDDGWLQISVEDNGAGLPSGVSPSDIFDRREESSRGSGWGLWMARGLIQTQGGHVIAVPQKPHGLTVTIEVPLGRGGIEQPSQRAREE